MNVLAIAGHVASAPVVDHPPGGPRCRVDVAVARLGVGGALANLCVITYGASAPTLAQRLRAWDPVAAHGELQHQPDGSVALIGRVALLTDSGAPGP